MLSQRETGNPVQIEVSRLIGLIISGHEVSSSMPALTEATSRLPLTNLDVWERLIRTAVYLSAPDTRRIKWKFWRKPAPIPAWIDLCSNDGFKREQALHTLTGAAPNRFFLALAARRLNDWVPQVRAAANEQLPSIAARSRAEDVVDVLCAVFANWDTWGRIGSTGKQTLLNIASTEAITLQLKSHLILSTTGPLATALGQAAQSPAFDKHLPEIARSAIQPSVRAKAYKFMMDGKIVWPAGRKWEWTDIRYCKGHFLHEFHDRLLSINQPLEDTLRAALTDRSPIVRRIAGDALIRKYETFGSSALQLATALASDSYPSVAERGRFVLNKISQMNSDLRT